MKLKSVVLAVATLCVVNLASAAVSAPARFDLGTENSPVHGGFVRVAGKTLYSPELGYGWLETGHESFQVERPERLSHWFLFRDIFFDETATPLNRDGVRNTADMTFKLDLPEGRYVVVVTLGDLSRGLGSMSVYANGGVAARNIDAKHWASRGGTFRKDATSEKEWYGFYQRVRFSVEVGQEGLELKFAGDESDYRKWLAEEENKPSPESWLVRGGRRLKPHAPYRDLGLPFTTNSVLAIEVYHFVPEPIVLVDGELVLDRSGVPPRANVAELGLVERALEAYNLGRFAEAERKLDRVSDVLLGYVRALGHAYLAGNPACENELELAPKAIASVEAYLEASPGDERATHLLEVLQNFAQGMDLIFNRAVSFSEQMALPSELRHADTTWENGYFRVFRGIGKLELIRRGEPVYYKAKIHEARGFYMFDPHRWVMASGKAADLLREVERKFPQNRFVRLYLHDEWTPGPEWPKFPDYSGITEGAPEWAAAVYEAYNRGLDLAEWWYENKQFPDGSIGGGWGDDVEALRFFGTYGSISSDASESIVNLCARIVGGALASPNMDPESGFFGGVADAEHTGEWTGDTIPTMVILDYGNPRWIELGLKVAKLMRDLWMDHNDRGQYLFRSNMVGATRVGTELQMNDSRINYRCALPARSVLWYNSNPAVAALFDQWARGWLEASMSTDKGKPRGVIPTEIGFEKGEIGGTQSPSWHKANHAVGTVNYDWDGRYHAYTVDLLVGARERSGDEVFLEPLRLEAELAAAYADDAAESPVEGSAAWAGKQLDGAVELWERLQGTLGSKEGSEPAVTSLETAVRRGTTWAKHAWERWPIVTVDALATDRIGWPDLGAAYDLMTAAGASGAMGPEVTYAGLGRQFAAVVLTSGTHHLKVAVYSFLSSEKECSIRPWLLQPGATYAATFGPDLDEDGNADSVAGRGEWSLEFRGQPCTFLIPPRTAYIVELRQVASGGKPSLLPDLAITEDDIEYSDLSDLVNVRVHNIGSAEARRFTVAVYDVQEDGGKTEVGRGVGIALPASLDLLPQTLRVGIPWTLPSSPGDILAVIDPDGEIEEITESNNSARVEAIPAGE